MPNSTKQIKGKYLKTNARNSKKKKKCSSRDVPLKRRLFEHKNGESLQLELPFNEQFPNSNNKSQKGGIQE